MGSEIPGYASARSNAAIARASNSTKRTSATDVVASRTAAMATGAASSSG